MRALITAVGLIGPGLPDWKRSEPMLSGAAAYQPAPVELAPVEALPAAERRRTGPPVRLALSVGLQALAHSGRSASEVTTVFTSSGGDGQVIHEICESLATPQREVSPTRFHNSVHNAPAGYWGIATRAHCASTSLCAFDWSFAAGLLEACTQVCTRESAVLLISYDLPYPEPLRHARTVEGLLGIALLLNAPAREHSSIGQLDLELTQGPSAPTAMSDQKLETLRQNNPTGRGLPLLAALSRGDDSEIALDYLGDTLRLRITRRG